MIPNEKGQYCSDLIRNIKIVKLFWNRKILTSALPHVCPFLTNGSNPHKLHSKKFKEINSIKWSGLGLKKKKKKKKKKNGNMLEALDWNLNLGAFRHLKNLRKWPIYYILPFVTNLFQKAQLFFLTKGSKCKECFL